MNEDTPIPIDHELPQPSNTFFSGSEFNESGLVEKARMFFKVNGEVYDPVSIMDDIKTDISVLKPREQTQLEVTADSINWIVRQNIGVYVPAEKLKSKKDIHKRIVIARSEDVARFLGAERDDVFSAEKDRVLSSPTGIIIARPMLGDNVGWRCASKELRENLLEQNGQDLKSARIEANERYLVRLLYEEIIKQYVDDRAPQGLRDAVGYYFADMLYEGYEIAPEMDAILRRKKREFESIIRKYGDDDSFRFIFGERTSVGAYRSILEDVSRSIFLN